MDRIHGDLHSNNWKVIRDKKQLKIVIYDFGFCIDIPKKSRNIIQDINKAIETNNHLLFANSIYKYLKRPCTREKFIEHTDLELNIHSHLRTDEQEYYYAPADYFFMGTSLSFDLYSTGWKLYFKRYDRFEQGKSGGHNFHAYVINKLPFNLQVRDIPHTFQFSKLDKRDIL